MRGNSHVRFGGRAEETDRPKRRHRASVRPNHTYASLLVEQGAHPKEMAELMGHSSVQITLDRYSHVMPHLATALADRMDAVYRAAEPISLVPDEPAASGNMTSEQIVGIGAPA